MLCSHSCTGLVSRVLKRVMIGRAISPAAPLWMKAPVTLFRSSNRSLKQTRALTQVDSHSQHRAAVRLAALWVDHLAAIHRGGQAGGADGEHRHRERDRERRTRQLATARR